MQFSIQQIALYPPDKELAIKLLKEMGLTDWVCDTVVARGIVRHSKVSDQMGHLAFNYQAHPAGHLELEVLAYRHGDYNWMLGNGPSVSHLGMHCANEQELEDWRKFFSSRGFNIAQEVETTEHTNAAIAGTRWYHYLIFDTRLILGVDIKLIVRRSVPPMP